MRKGVTWALVGIAACCVMADSCASPGTVTEPSSTAATTPTATAHTTPRPAPPTKAPTAAPIPVTSGFNHAAAKQAGATAICRDGSWSYSAHRSGTCSHHGGVNWWTGNLGPPGPG
jgi:Protein of unknown function (DUF3761)